MNKKDGVIKVVNNLSERAQSVVDGNHSQIEIMKSAMVDFKGLGNISGMMSIMSSGTLNKSQLELAQRIAVKVIAVLGMIEAENNKGA